ncbi:HET-domain-containing protein [Corynespora cassiicola Philippines]|uniref:HET-domain-containing protein n=1 Tax=Corynespora cassiicola Philippines TaxID=1448308 RepID=A0A2T2N600_CORCC|nr:HET-domain-containing protein [Corynespora cassiicola Philippines]
MADHRNPCIPFLDRDKNTQQAQQLCLQCRGITLESMLVPGGYFHYAHFYEIVVEAEHCIMCKLIRDGLRRNFADKPCIEGSTTALDRHLNVLKDGPFQDGPVIIKPWVASETASSRNRQTGLNVYITAQVSCFLNWCPQFTITGHTILSPLRPVGLQKLHLARRWFVQSLPAEVQNPYFEQRSTELRGEHTLVSPKPTRLIYLGENQYYPPKYVRLISSWADHNHGANIPHYITLSHRWGSSQHLKTTKSNFLEHLLRIKFLDLPRTFQDAAVVALFLGVRYLWIDTLCIIQDDSMDWHREALLMGRIYENSVCTIAVHNARDNSDGFLERSLQPQPSVVLGHYQKGGEFYVSLRSNFKAEVDHSELSGRGWVLQERYLSSRTLHFTTESIFFEDFNGVKTEEVSFTETQDRIKGFNLQTRDEYQFAGSVSTNELSWEIPKQPWLDTTTPANGKDSIWGSSSIFSTFSYQPVPELRTTAAFNISYRLRSGRYEDLLYQWFEIVERYSKTELTFATDKLPAISGLARYIQSHTGKEYFSGIWEPTFHIGLVWASDRHLIKRTTSSRAPSWSWASVDGPIQHPRLRGDIKRRSQLLKVERQGDSSFNSSASITLRAQIKPIYSLASYDTESEVEVFGNVIKKPPYVREIIDYVEVQPLIWFSPQKLRDHRHQSSTDAHLEGVGWAAIDDESDDIDNVYCALISAGVLPVNFNT